MNAIFRKRQKGSLECNPSSISDSENEILRKRVIYECVNMIIIFTSTVHGNSLFAVFSYFLWLIITDLYIIIFDFELFFITDYCIFCAWIINSFFVAHFWIAVLEVISDFFFRVNPRRQMFSFIKSSVNQWRKPDYFKSRWNHPKTYRKSRPINECKLLNEHKTVTFIKNPPLVPIKINQFH